MKPSESLGKAADVVGVIGGIVCIIAGLYLLGSQTQDASSYLQTIAHGIGIYFVGKGLYVLQSVVRNSDQAWFLARIRNPEVDNAPPMPASVTPTR
jgi:hypothetical protein